MILAQPCFKKLKILCACKGINLFDLRPEMGCVEESVNKG